MYLKAIKFSHIIFLILLVGLNNSFAEIVKKIQIEGNDRVSSDTIKLFSGVKLNDDLNTSELNQILKKLYDTNFFKDIALNLNENVLFINVKENPIIEKITYKGIKRKKTLDEIRKDALFKSRSSFNEYILGEEKNRLYFILKDLGYYNSQINIFVKNKEDNLVDIEIDLILGERAKIKKISFVGNKIFKDSKLKRIIASSEYKFWKFLSGRKFLNENVVEFDKRLLKNFYKNNGYYNVQINSSFAKLIDKNEFELVFNIDARPKIYFGELNLNLPIDFEKENFSKIYELFDDIKNEHYSINVIDKILDEIDTITTLEQYKFIKATVEENIVNDKINLSFNIGESEKFYVEKINIFGNTVTSENVIRNQFDVDEGDPFNELLVNKSINNIKSLNFFKTVKNEVITNEKNKTKVLNIIVEEKPTGEISAQAGIGTSGGSVGFGIKENNFLGKGIGLDSNFTLSDNSFKGKFTVSNPNFRNSDKSIYGSVKQLKLIIIKLLDINQIRLDLLLVPILSIRIIFFRFRQFKFL